MAPLRERIIVGSCLGAWIGVVTLLLIVFGLFSLARLFVLSLVGLLVLMDLTAAFELVPRWRSRFRWVVAVCLILYLVLLIGIINQPTI